MNFLTRSTEPCDNAKLESPGLHGRRGVTLTEIKIRSWMRRIENAAMDILACCRADSGAAREMSVRATAKPRTERRSGFTPIETKPASIS